MRVLSTCLVAFSSFLLAGTATAQFASQKPTPAGKGAVTTPQRGGASTVAPISPGRSFLPPAAGTTALLVGGGDDCATPDVIAGPGSVLFDLTAATTGTQGQTEALCYFFGSTVVDSDVWFAWTSNSTGTATITTCGTTTVDTKISVYAGSACPAGGSAIACNDDACGFQSSVNFPVVNGSTYMLQIGTFPGAATGTGTFDITVGTSPTNDDCATPAVIAGLGPHNFNNSLAATGAQGQAEALCYFFGSTTIDNDVWFTWTAPSTNTMIVSTCGQTTVDTKIAVYQGAGCPAGASIGCNDDACGTLQSSTNFNAVAGNTYTIQLGTFPGAAGGTGTFTFEIDPCSLLAADIFEENDDCPQAVTIGDGTYLNLNVSRTDWDYYLVNVAAGDTLDVAVLHTQANGDIDSFLYLQSNCQTFGAGDVGTAGSLVSGFTSSDDEFMTWTNTTGATQTYTIKLNIWPPSTNGDCNDYTLVISGTTGGVATPYCFGDGSGTPCPCGNTGGPGRGCDNNTGSTGALLSSTGSNSVAAGDLVLVGEGAQPNQPGLYFQGNNAIAGGLGITNGDGLRCAGGNVRRIQVRLANASGASATTVNVAAQGLALPGETKRYQWWYRNPSPSAPCGTTFNLSNGVEVVWAP